MPGHPHLRHGGSPLLLGFSLLASILSPAAHAETPAATPLPEMTIPLRPDGPGDAIQTAVIRARAARERGWTRPIVISLAPGIYRPSAPIRIEGDFGNGGLIIRGEPGGPVEIRGSVPLPPAAPGSGEKQSAAEASGGAAALTMFKAPDGAAGDPKAMPGLYQGDVPLALARFPASGYMAAQRQPDPRPGVIRVKLPGLTPGLLAGKQGLWVDGYFRNSYTHEWMPVTAVDGDMIDIADAAPPNDPLNQRIPNPPVAINNAAVGGEPAPGAYLIAEGGKALALRSLPGGGPVERASLDRIFVISAARNVTIEGVSVGMVRKMAIEITQSSDITIRDSAIGWSDNAAIRAIAGGNVTVARTIVHHTGGRGVEFIGGDRQTLTPSGDKLVDSIVMDFGRIDKSYHAGVTLAGVGAEVSGSLIANGPHAGLIFFGNNHMIHDNEFTQVVQDRGDAGAIYVGRDWTQRGTEISRNYFHDIGWGQQNLLQQFPMTVYLDDYTSDTLVKDNLFVRTAYPVMIGGGQDNVIEGNAFVASIPAAIRFDARGESWGRDMILNPKMAPLNALNAVPIKGELYRRAYPQLATLLEDDPRRPKNNVISGNTYYGGMPLWLENDVARTNPIEKPDVKPLDLARVQACAGRSSATIDMLAATGILGKDNRTWSRLPALSTLRYYGIVAPELAGQTEACN